MTIDKLLNNKLNFKPQRQCDKARATYKTKINNLINGDKSLENLFLEFISDSNDPIGFIVLQFESFIEFNSMVLAGVWTYIILRLHRQLNMVW